jgi:hypothetical protein
MKVQRETNLKYSIVKTFFCPKIIWFIEDQREDCSLSLREDARVRGRS